MPEEFKLTEDARSLVVLSSKMKTLVEDPNFLAYQKVLEGQVQTWSELISMPCAGVDAAFGNEFSKGTLYGIRLILGLPNRIISEAKDLIARQENSNERPTFTRPGESFTGNTGFPDSPESIAEQLGEPVGPNARVTADSN